MRVIDRPELYALTPGGECERLRRELATVTRERKAQSEPLLAPALKQAWDDLACMCRQGGYASINVASVTRRKAIIAVDEILRANSVISLKTEAYQRGNNKETP